MAVNLSPIGGVAGQFFDNNGDPLVGGKLYTYAAGTTTPQVTYTSATGVTPNSNPIILNGGGRVPAEIWLTDGLQYKFVLYTSTDTLIGSWDNITGINSNFVNFVTSEEVQTATAGQTVFTLTTMQYQPSTNNLVVYVDGVNQIEGGTYSFVETSSTVVTFTNGLHVGALVKFVSAETLSTGISSAANVTFTGFKSQTGVVQDIADDDGSDWIGFEPAGAGAVAMSVQDKLRETVSVKDFGAVGDGVTDDTAAIQGAIDAINTVGGGAVYFPTGEYKITSTITIYSNMKLYGNGKASLLKWGDTTAGDIFSRNSSTIENVTITGLGFDGSINYPATSNVGVNTFTEYNSAISFTGTTVTNLIVQNCYFNQLSNSSIDINGISSSNIVIDANIFNKGAYRFKVISVRTPTNPATRAEYPNSIVVSNNIVNENGPQLNFDPNPAINWNGSADAIQLDQCRDSLVIGNVVKLSSSIGIRIEECENVTVCGNTTFDTGASGITLYNESNNCSVVGNVVENFGKIPQANAIRSYAGNYYVSRETVSPAYGVSPPADPSASAFFDIWPYSLDNVNIANIQAYSVLETTLLPFRGDAGISATARSKNNTITGNIVTRNTSVDGSGKYFYANDFGFTVVHPVNNPSNNGSTNIITGNRFAGQVYDIYHPQYTDPINANGTLTNSTYGVNETLNNNFIYINALTFDELDVRSEAGTGTETLLTLLNQTNVPATGLGVKIDFQAILSSNLGSLSAAMKNVSFNAGSEVVLSSRSDTGSTVELNSGGASRFIAKGTGQSNFVPLASAPSGASEGDVYFNTTTKKLQCYDGTVWQDLF
jgi:parallel beta-helix repeat protein